jgi:hypothetical protein
MAFNIHNTWFGLGVKTGGMLIVVGFESTEGKIYNIGNPSYSYRFMLGSPRLGLGLGAGIGVVALGIFNCTNPFTDLHNKAEKFNDWGVNVSLTAKWSAMVKALKNAGFYQKIAQIGAKEINLTHVEKIREGLHIMYNTLELDTVGPETKVVAFDLPGCGTGLEVSASYSFNKFEIDLIR